MTGRHLSVNGCKKIVTLVKGRKYWFVAVLLVLLSKMTMAQCPQLLNEAGVPTANPVFLLCSKDPRTLFISFNRNFGAYTINWGDGSGVTNGASYTTGNVVSHNYAAGVNNYTLTITIPGPPNCVITATVIKEEPTTASIQVPFGGVTRACAPASLDFVNSSTNNSQNTIYVWNFGDGSANQTFTSTNQGQTIAHMYLRGTVDCITRVTLTAYNQCNLRQNTVSIAEYYPILIWDLDKPSIGSDTLFCYPDTTVTYTNTTLLNCAQPGQGNVEPRTEYWRFIDFKGPGIDSIIDWRPFGPPRTLHYPGIGTYRVELRERSFCGEVSTIKTIRIIEAPIAGITANKDTICIGESITFTNTSTGPANIYRWDPGDGNGFRPFSGATQTISYSQSGNYQVKIAINVNGGSQSCKDTALVPVVVVPDPIANFSIDDTVGCDSLHVVITNTSTGAINWKWSLGQGDSAFTTTPPQLDFKSPGMYIISLGINSNQGCNSNHSDSVYVFSSPKVNISAPNNCEDLVIPFTNNTTFDPNDPVTSWNWDFGDTQTSTQHSPTHVFQIGGNFNVVLLAKTPFCQGTGSAPLIIYSQPNSSPGANKSDGCTPLSVQFGNTSTGAATYAWDFGDGGNSSLATPQHTFVNNGTTTLVFNVRLIARSAFGCLDTNYFPVTVYPAAIASFDYTAENKCISLLVNFINTSSGASTYKWYFGDGDSSVAVNPQHDYINQGTFVAEYDAVLIVTSANGCKDTISKKVSVNPEAKFGFTASPDSGCSPLQVNFTAKSGAASYQWDFPDGTKPTGVFVQKTFVNNGSTELKFKVKLTAQNASGCFDVTEQEVTVFPNPAAAIQLTPSQGCAPLTTTLTNNTSGGVSYDWDYGDGNSSQVSTPAHTYIYPNSTAGPLVYKIILTAYSQFGCMDTAQAFVRVFPLVNATFDTLVSGCGPLVKTYTGFGGSNYFWNFGNGDVSNQATYTTTFTNSGHLQNQVYPVKMIAYSTYGCTDTVNGQAIVFPSPDAAFNPDKLQGCPPLPVNLNNTSVGATNYTWFYGDGNTASQNAVNHQYLFTNSGTTTRTYTIQMIAVNANNCRDTTTRQVSVFHDITARFVHDTLGCDPFPVKFFNTSSGAATYDWDLDIYGSSTLTEPAQVFTNSTQTSKVYNIRLIANSLDNCKDTAYSAVRVHPKPLASFGLDKDKGCQPLTVNIQNSSAGANSYKWTYGLGGGSTSAAPVQQKIYPNGADTSVKYPIELIAFNSFGCSDTISKMVTVYPKVLAAFDTLLPGCTPLTQNVINRSVGASFITWNFNNDGVSFNNIENHTFTNTSVNDEVKFIELIAENSFQCRDTVRRLFTVYPKPTASFLATPVLQRYPDASVSISNTTAGTWLTLWDFGNSTSSSSPNPGVITYATWGDYVIKLRVTGQHCDDTISRLITILPPIPSANFNGGGVGCKPTTFAFTNTSAYGATYDWNFGDGGKSTLKDPVYTYYDPGTYTVTLKTTGFGGETDVETKVAVVTIHDNAEAYFTYNPEFAATGIDPVDLVNLSKRADYYFWDFGDGETSTDENPTHIYQREGVYDIVLIADNQWHCPDTFLVKNAVKVENGGSIDLPTAFTPNPGGSSGGRYDARSISNDVFFPFNKEVEVFKMEIFSRWGEKIFESNDVNIGWDGYFNGKLCLQDVYVYKVEAIFKGGKKYQKVGDVTLLR